MAGFKARALPLHVHITHTPPVLSSASSKRKFDKDEDEDEGAEDGDAEEDEEDEEEGGGKDLQDVVLSDPGYIGSATLVPTSFDNDGDDGDGGSGYGWAAEKRVPVESVGMEGGEVVVEVLFA